MEKEKTLWECQAGINGLLNARLDAHAQMYKHLQKQCQILRLWIIALLIFMIGVVVMPSRAEAGEFHLQFHGLSKHWGPKPANGWNEKNWGLGLRYQFNPEWGIQGGFYDNSHGRNTNYLIADWTPILNGRFGLFAGLASGYDPKYPVVGGLMYREQIGRASVTLRVIPRVAEDRAGVVAIEAGWRF